ncbi:hypothetical protein LIER_11247 [Lithospermum erythrorhizon]|uniref:Uncharacterized protein n=1 Tax=Lithospermum erythrorhizon TaxID=34254 RepID=A0AAV3PMD8_LITER
MEHGASFQPGVTTRARSGALPTSQDNRPHDLPKLQAKEAIGRKEVRDLSSHSSQPNRERPIYEEVIGRKEVRTYPLIPVNQPEKEKSLMSL